MKFTLYITQVTSKSFAFNYRAKRLRYGLLLFIFLLTWEGAVRKWVFPTYEQVIFVFKDLIILILFIQAFSLISRLALPKVSRLYLQLFAIWVFIESVNPHLPSVLVGLWGLKSYLIYIGLVFVLLAAYDSLGLLFRHLTIIYPLIVIPVSVLASYQLTLGFDSELNNYLRGESANAGFGEAGLVRVSGSFSYIAGMAAFLQVASLFGLGLYLAGARSFWFLVGFAVILLNVPVTGSRSVIFVIILGTALMVILGKLAGVITNRVLLSAVFLLLVFLVISLHVQDDAWVALQQRIEYNQDEGVSRIFNVVTNAFVQMPAGGLFGFGAGATNNAAAFLASDYPAYSWLPPLDHWFEAESGRMVLELGAFGWLLSLLLRISFMMLSLKMSFLGATPLIRITGVIAFPFMAYGVYAGFGTHGGSFILVGYWICVGLISLAYRENLRIVRSAVNRLSMPPGITGS